MAILSSVSGGTPELVHRNMGYSRKRIGACQGKSIAPHHDCAAAPPRTFKK
jgi:hypothetical protein